MDPSSAPGTMQGQPLRMAGSVLTKCFHPYARQPIPQLDSVRALRRSNPCLGLFARGFVASKQQFVESGYVQAAKDLNQKGLDDQESQLDHAISQEKEKQLRTPWHREGSNVPPVKRQRSAGAMTKGSSIASKSVLTANKYVGKLLTTPSRLLKLILPLTTLDKNSDRKDVEPLALLVHPQQPLSYLERLIQSELPTIKNNNGEEKVPAVYFRAEDSEQDDIEPKTKTPEEERHDQEEEDELEETRFDGRVERTGKLNRKTKKEASDLRGGPGEGGVESYSGLGHEGESPNENERRFVRWSSSTDIGDFIRDAARGKEFAVEIEGAPKNIHVGVPSFKDRTHYLRMRLRKTSRKIMDMAQVKKECDLAAHRAAQRVAMGGFGVLVGWWYIVYRLTFETDLGWDTMEPVTVSAVLEAGSLQVLTMFTVSGWPFYPDVRLPLVSVPQPRSILQIRSQPHNQPATDETLSSQRVRFTEVGAPHRGRQCSTKGD